MSHFNPSDRRSAGYSGNFGQPFQTYYQSYNYEFQTQGFYSEHAPDYRLSQNYTPALDEQFGNFPQNPSTRRVKSQSYGHPSTDQHHGLFQDIGATTFANIPPPIAEMGANYLENVFIQNQRVAQGNFNRIMSELKGYFHVNTSYVSNKLKLILFPFLHKSWSRQIVSDDTTGELRYRSPKTDINAPDLYVGLMGFVTFILAYGFIKGAMETFSPEILATTASKGFGIILLEVLLLKLGVYLLVNGVSVPFFDLLANCAYIFVGIVVNLFFFFVFGPTIYSLVTLYTSSALGWFMIKTLRSLVRTDAANPYESSFAHRNYFIVFFAILQIALMFWLGH